MSYWAGILFELRHAILLRRYGLSSGKKSGRNVGSRPGYVLLFPTAGDGGTYTALKK